MHADDEMYADESCHEKIYKQSSRRQGIQIRKGRLNYKLGRDLQWKIGGQELSESKDYRMEEDLIEKDNADQYGVTIISHWPEK